MPARTQDFARASAETLALQRLAADQYAAQRAIAAATASATLAAWREADTERLVESWIRIVAARAWRIVTLGQTLAAQRARRYVRRAAAVYPSPPVHRGESVPERLAAIAADGRRLDTLLQQPAVTVAREVREGRPRREAMTIGTTQLDMIVRTEVADAGRVATGVEITATPTLGYVRMLNPPSCARCVVLAGKFYRWNQGFLRHPRCDCIHIPVSEDAADDLTTDPRRYFDSLDEREQRRAFTEAGAQAIRDGADIARVVNARRRGSVYTAGGRAFTTEATRRRRRGAPRLMPEQIYREANGNRDEAIRLLRLHGYLI